MSIREQRELLARERDACVSYRKIIPVAVVAVAMSLAPAAQAADPVPKAVQAETGAEELVAVVVGAIGGPIVEALFRESALPEPRDRHTSESPASEGEG